MLLVDKLREEILSMPDADFRIREQDLAEKFGLSRAPIREALKQLENENLIERKRKKGITLRRFTIKEVADAYDLRSVLEGFSGRLAAHKATAEQIQKLEEAAKAYQKTEVENVDPQLRAECDDNFHRLIVELADNPQLAAILKQCAILKQAFSFYVKKENRFASIAHTPYSHIKIVEAIRQRDGDTAEDLLRQHSQWAKQRLLERFTDVDFNSMD